MTLDEADNLALSKNSDGKQPVTTPAVEQSQQLSAIFGPDVAQQGIEVLKGMSHDDVAQLGMAAHRSLNAEKMAFLKPSADLFSTSVYTLYDKSPEQIAVDTRAIISRREIEHEINWLRRQAAGEAVHIDLAGKSGAEIAQLNLELNAKAARRNEAEREFSSNPVVAGLDTVSSIATAGGRSFEKCATGITAFVKENPGMTLAGVLGGGAFLMGGDDFGIGKFALFGAALVIGASWMYTSHPDKFNELAGQFGIEQFFNTAPNSPMLASAKSKTVFAPPTPEVSSELSKFGDVSAETAGSVSAPDSGHLQQMQEMKDDLKALAQNGISPSKIQSRQI